MAPADGFSPELCGHWGNGSGREGKQRGTAWTLVLVTWPVALVIFLTS